MKNIDFPTSNPLHYEVVRGEEGSNWTDYWASDREKPNPYRENPLENVWSQ